MRQSTTRLPVPLLSLLCVAQLLIFHNSTSTPTLTHAFVTPQTQSVARLSRPSKHLLRVSELDKEQEQQQQQQQQQQQKDDDLAAQTQELLAQQAAKNRLNNNGSSSSSSSSTIPRTLRIEGQGIPSRASKVQLLDSSTYESYITKTWETDPSVQSGFDWEIEKLRRYAAGLRMRADGSWVKQPSLFDFLVSPSRYQMASSSENNAKKGPPAAGLTDSVKVFGVQFLTSLGFGPALGMAAIPAAVIQKYEGSFFSFIKGVLGGDLQTLAGGPLFLLLAKYFEEYGPIFNLSL
eukprot:scaffold34690_cov288-Amphora_coffeaeformis.AAC.9